MTFNEFASEIKEKINSKQKYRQGYGEKTNCIYIIFYENGEASITYKMSPDVWEKVKEIIKINNNENN